MTKAILLRLLTASGLLIVMYFFLFVLSSEWLLGLLLLSIFLCALEWTYLSWIDCLVYWRVAYAFLVTIATSVLLATGMPPMIYYLNLSFFVLVVPFLLLNYRGQQFDQNFGNVSYGFSVKLFLGLLGMALLAVFAKSFYQLYQLGPKPLMYVMSIVWLADSGAYFSGKMFGKHKLLANVSPGKTWEGVAGGLLMVWVFSGLLRHWLVPGLPMSLAWFGLMAALVILSVLGDLFESLLKRCSNIKDSGFLLPGHGGILDRIDGLIPVLPLMALLMPLLLKTHGV